MKQYAPRFDIQLYQIASGNKQKDITKWFGDGCVIRTRKSVREPAGAFQFVLVDKIDPDTGDSLYGSVAPMDVVEVRGAHDGSQSLTLLIRGFVTDVRRSESMGADGRPRRTVTITGHDMGKITEIQYIIYPPTPDEQGVYLSGFGNLYKYFDGASRVFSANDFVEKWATILNGLWHSMADVNGALKKLDISPRATVEGSVPWTVLSSLVNVTFHQFATHLLDVGVFQEMFCEDYENGSYLVVRPVFDSAAGEVDVADSDLVDISVARTDAGVANWFRVMPASALLDQMTITMQSLIVDSTKMDARKDPRCLETVYGWRPLEVTANLYPPDYSNSAAPTEGEVREDAGRMEKWLNALLTRLHDTNVENALLESGSLKLRGNESVKAGRWINLQRGVLKYRFYAVAVDHDIAFGGNWTMNVQVERGDGWKQRQAAIQGKRYLLELNQKGAT